MRFRAGADVLFGVGEEVVWAGAAEVRAADLRGVEGEGRGLGGGGGGTQERVAHELLEKLALFGCHGGRMGVGDDQTVKILSLAQVLGRGEGRRDVRKSLRRQQSAACCRRGRACLPIQLSVANYVQ